jgi:glycosyltransferase involved in cell wall biosynthesis
MKPHISIIIPAFNEEARIETTLDSICESILSSHLSAEILVVDDGSSDRTIEVAEGRLARHPAVRSRVLRYDGNRGKGYAVRFGMERSEADIIVFSDADLSTPIDELAKVVKPIENDECDVAFGSRAVDRSLIGERQPWRREQGGKIFNLIVRMFTGLSASDTQCGFKAFNMLKFRRLLPTLSIDRFGFDVEMLVAANENGLRLREIPVRWNNDERSKVSFLRDSVRMFQEVLIIRNRIRKGAYRIETTP